MEKNKDQYLTAFKFVVFVKNEKIGFRTISGIKIGAAFEPLAVGGYNSAPIMLPVPVKDVGRLTMERGVSSLNALQYFVPGLSIGDEMQIHILNENGKTGVAYSVLSPFLESVELSKLDALESSAFIETFTVIHHGISLL